MVRKYQFYMSDGETLAASVRANGHIEALVKAIEWHNNLNSQSPKKKLMLTNRYRLKSPSGRLHTLNAKTDEFHDLLKTHTDKFFEDNTIDTTPLPPLESTELVPFSGKSNLTYKRPKIIDFIVNHIILIALVVVVLLVVAAIKH